MIFEGLSNLNTEPRNLTPKVVPIRHGVAVCVFWQASRCHYESMAARRSSPTPAAW